MVKIRPVVDTEASEKNTIKNSPLGKWMMSDKKCPHCHTPALEQWKGECVKCGKDLNTPEPAQVTPPVAPVVVKTPPEAPKKTETPTPTPTPAPKKKSIPTSTKKHAPEPEPVEETVEEEVDEEPVKKYECKKCGSPVDINDEACPKCGCPEAVEVD